MAPVLAQIYVSQDSFLLVEQEIQELQTANGADGIGGGSHLGRGRDRCEGHPGPLLPISRLHTTQGLSRLSSIPARTPGPASTSKYVLRG